VGKQRFEHCLDMMYKISNNVSSKTAKFIIKEKLCKMLRNTIIILKYIVTQNLPSIVTGQNVISCIYDVIAKMDIEY
jgi:hypothetical protein